MALVGLMLIQFMGDYTVSLCAVWQTFQRYICHCLQARRVQLGVCIGFYFEKNGKGKVGGFVACLDQ
jgi:hypothetical protein